MIYVTLQKKYGTRIFRLQVDTISPFERQTLSSLTIRYIALPIVNFLLYGALERR